MMRLDDFRNVVATLRCLDLPDMQAAGLFCGARNCDAREDPNAAEEWRKWTSFRQEPINFLFYADDDVQRAIWTMVERHIEPTIDVSEAHRNDTQAAP